MRNDMFKYDNYFLRWDIINNKACVSVIACRFAQNGLNIEFWVSAKNASNELIEFHKNNYCACWKDVTIIAQDMLYVYSIINHQ